MKPTKGTLMENDDFRRIGEDLFGNGWQTRLSRALGVDGSTVRRWVGAAVPVPPQTAAFLHLLGSRQETRGALVFALQNPPPPIDARTAPPGRLEWMRRKLIFPGVQGAKPMPSVRATESNGIVGIELDGLPRNDITTNGVSFTLTRHPDSRHLAGYVAAAQAKGYAPVVVSHRFHHYSIIAHSTPHDGGEPRILHQISTHSGVLRTIEQSVGDDAVEDAGTLEVLPGGDAADQD